MNINAIANGYILLESVLDLSVIEHMFCDKEAESYINYMHATQMYRHNVIFTFKDSHGCMAMQMPDMDKHVKYDSNHDIKLLEGLVSLYGGD